jgi:hypothetical protein
MKTQTLVVKIYGETRKHRVPDGWVPIEHTQEGRWLYVGGYVYDIQELEDYGLKSMSKPRPKTTLQRPRPRTSERQGERRPTE